MQIDKKIDILSLSLAEIVLLMAELSQKPFRAKQLFSWLHKSRVSTFDEMSDLSVTLRADLAERCYIRRLVEKRRQVAEDGTIKFLFELDDKNTLESVLMCHDYGNSLCISTQVGCRMGCKFCASTIAGKERDLAPSEMLAQIYQVGELTEKKIDSIVLMGIGEPLDNFDSVMRFLDLVKDENGLCLSHRHVSLSTCGIIPEINRLADLKLQITLSVSLHASDNRTRTQIMPINQAYPIEDLMEACIRYFEITHRRISYEYALISKVNDTAKDAKALADLLRGQNCHVNLIPVNPVAEAGYQKPNRRDATKFKEILIKSGLSSTIRRELGSEIDAACGQLRCNDIKEG